MVSVLIQIMQKVEISGEGKDINRTMLGRDFRGVENRVEINLKAVCWCC